MLLEFWKNPEFIRHVRAELRPARMVYVVSLVAIICGLAGLFCWAMAEGDRRDFLGSFYATLLCAQGVVLCLWWSSACSDAIAGERVLKTYDFLRTTRLTADELMVGKLMGAPAVGLFAVACSLPVSITVGMLYGFSPGTLAVSYLLLAIFAPVFGLVSLVISMSVERPMRGLGFSGFLILYFLVAVSLVAGEGPFPALSALSPAPALAQLHRVQAEFDLPKVDPLMFGRSVNLLFLTPALLATLAVWLVMMLRRNLKREVDEISLLSRRQGLALAVYVNLLFYAFLDRSKLGSEMPSAAPDDVVQFMMLVLNAALLFGGAGVGTITPRESLKIWWRRHKAGEASYFSENGLSWPWLVLTALIGYAMLVVYALGTRSQVPLKEWDLGWMATQLVFLLVFAVRDVLFLQWCRLTRMKNAVTRGAGLLALYYIAVIVVMVTVHSVTERFDGILLAVLTPLAPANKDIHVAVSVAGIALQVAACVLLLTAITRRLDRPVTAPVVAD
jgi:hypothetical protein